MELRKYWEVLWRRRRLFLMTMGGIVLLTLIWAFSVSPIYQATTKILVKMQDTASLINSTVPSALGKLEFTTYSNAVTTVIEMIKTHEALNNMIHDMGLTKRNGKPFSSVELLDSNLIHLTFNPIGVRIHQITNADIIEIDGFSQDPELAVRLSDQITAHALHVFNRLNREAIAAAIRALDVEIKRIEELIRDADDTIKRYKIDHDAVNLNEKIENYTSKLVTTEMSIISLSIEKKESHPDVKAALDQIAYLRKEMKGIPEKQTEISRLQRMQSALNDLYIALIGDLEKAKLMHSLSIANIAVVDRASIPDAMKKYYIYFPKKKVMLLLSMIIGSFLGVISVFMAEYLDDTVKNANELQVWTKRKVLAAIPWSDRPGHLGENGMLQAVNDMWLAILLEMKQQAKMDEPRVICFTSYGVNEGKSTVAAHLGFLLAKIGYKTLLVDFNFAHPSLPELLRNHNAAEPYEGNGTSSRVVSGDMKKDPFEISKTDINNLFALHPGSASPDQPLIMGNYRSILDAIGMAKEKFDKMVIDLSALNVCKYPSFIAGESDMTILVVEARKHRMEHILWALQDLQESGVQTGAVLNKYKSDAS
ncbi:GumC family protein [Desulfatirhabdium butyrativorans]|uniref:GumC family protein n=1 Tax=Desulfatirhabdium butyrativorans TaxID=340467 RepID=UPI0003F4FD11|nr:Wzz/FepE/Etk N-terminal domain-containing protein [Desulfatirhabdium butyrativorans]